MYSLKIISNSPVSVNTNLIRIEKPEGFRFVPGHSIMISLPDRQQDKRPYSFISHPDDPYLEFIIKYYDHPESVAKRIHSLSIGESLLLSEMFGSIRYSGPGIFVVAGTAICPVLGILRSIGKENAKYNIVIYSAKKKEDLLFEDELKEILGNNLIITLTQEKKEGYLNGRIYPELIKKYQGNFYVLGPEDFVYDVKNLVSSLKTSYEKDI